MRQRDSIHKIVENICSASGSARREGESYRDLLKANRALKERVILALDDAMNCGDTRTRISDATKRIKYARVILSERLLKDHRLSTPYRGGPLSGVALTWLELKEIYRSDEKLRHLEIASDLLTTEARNMRPRWREADWSSWRECFAAVAEQIALRRCQVVLEALHLRGDVNLNLLPSRVREALSLLPEDPTMKEKAS